MYKLVLILFAALLVASCSKQTSTENLPNLTVAQITTNTGDYVGKTVKITGTVVHVCRHGGKRMFIIGDEPEPRFKITTGNSIAVFDVALEGSDVTVEGIVQEQKVDTAFLDNWETEISEENKPEVAHEGNEHAAGGEVADDHQSASDQIDNLRKQLAESGKEALSFYSLECNSFKEKKSGV